MALKALDGIANKSEYIIVFSGIDQRYSKNIEILKKIANKTQLDVRFYNFKNMSEGYTLADFVCLTSKSESFGYAALESLFLCRKTFVTCIPTYKEIYHNAKNVYELEYNLSNFALSLNNEKDLLTPLQQNKAWKDRFSIENMALNYLKSYEK